MELGFANSHIAFWHILLRADDEWGELRQLVVQVVEKLWRFCWQFVGSEDVSMGSSDSEHVIGRILGIRRLSLMKARLKHNRKALDCDVPNPWNDP